MSGIRSHVLSLLTALAFGCGGGDASSAGPGTTSVAAAQLEINLTDAPGDFSEVVVTIDGIEIETTKSNGLVPLTLNIDVPVGGPVIFVNRAEGSVTVDLNNLTGGRTMRLATGEVPGGRITKIRLHVIESSVNGTPTPWVREAVAGARRSLVKMTRSVKAGIDIVPRNVHVDGNSLNRVTIDFNAKKSIVLHTKKGKNGQPNTIEYHLKPVIFLLESESTAAPATTIAAGLNFPRAIAYQHGNPDDTSDDRIVVASTGSLGVGPDSNASTVVRFNPNDFDGIAAQSLAESGPATERVVVGPNLRDVSSDELLAGWHAIDAVEDRAIVGLAPDTMTISYRLELPVDKLVATTQVPSISGGGPAWCITYETETTEIVVDKKGKSNSVTTTRGQVALFEPAISPDPIVLIADAPENPTDILFVPGYPAGRFGTVYIACRGKKGDDGKDDRLLAATLILEGLTLRVDGPVLSYGDKEIDFINEPVGLALNTTGDGIWIPQRGNGFIHLLDLDLNPIDILNTGLGPNALNGIEVLAFPALAGLSAEPQVLLLTNTQGDDEPANDDPLDEDDSAISSIEAVVPR